LKIVVGFFHRRHFTSELKTTENQVLLEEYAQSGSESAFRELVSRYIGLVYSTALRLVSGDTHRAEDVAQMMFINLARKAPSLPNGVALGGWLHQSAYNIAAPMMRAERRRQGREREAVQMNALHDDSNADLSVHTITDGESSTVNEARRPPTGKRFSFDPRTCRSRFRFIAG
jgi:DNA-directed RNA polymerase specialized sigma24 family protein